MLNRNNEFNNKMNCTRSVKPSLQIYLTHFWSNVTGVTTLTNPTLTGRAPRARIYNACLSISAWIMYF